MLRQDQHHLGPLGLGTGCSSLLCDPTSFRDFLCLKLGLILRPRSRRRLPPNAVGETT